MLCLDLTPNLLFQLFINLVIFAISLLGIFFSRKHILLILIGFEIMLLSLNLNFILLSVYLDDIMGWLFALFILTIAAAELSVGIAIVIVYFRINNHIQVTKPMVLKS